MRESALERTDRKRIKAEGDDAHNALADAEFQVRHLFAIDDYLKGVRHLFAIGDYLKGGTPHG